MNNRMFIDSNVWVYLFSENEDYRSGLAQTFLENNVTHSILVTSYQVVNEVCNVLKRYGMAEEKIRVVIENLTSICIIQDLSKEVCLTASALREKILAFILGQHHCCHGKNGRVQPIDQRRYAGRANDR